MEFSNIFQRPIDLSALIGWMIECYDSNGNFSTLSRYSKEDPDFLEDCINNRIQEVTFLRLLDVAMLNATVQKTLPDVVNYVSDDSITDKVFRKIMEESKLRKCLIVSLSHKTLDTKKLFTLCEDGTCFECFFTLALRLYTSEDYSAEQYECYLDYFLHSKYSYMARELYSELCNAMPNTVEKSILTLATAVPTDTIR